MLLIKVFKAFSGLELPVGHTHYFEKACESPAGSSTGTFSVVMYRFRRQF